MEPHRILQVGIDSSVVDFSPWPGQDTDQLRARISAARDALRRVINAIIALRPGVRLCFNDSPETTVEAVRRALRR